MQFLAVVMAWLAWAWGMSKVMTVQKARGIRTWFMAIFSPIYYLGIREKLVSSQILEGVPDA